MIDGVAMLWAGPLDLFTDTLPYAQPLTMGECYNQRQLVATPGDDGFIHVSDIPFSARGIRDNSPDWRWFFSRETLSPCASSCESLNNGRRWHITLSTSNVPEIGRRLAVSGGLHRTINPTLQDDGFANDALWLTGSTNILEHASKCPRAVFNDRSNDSAPPVACRPLHASVGWGWGERPEAARRLRPRKGTWAWATGLLNRDVRKLGGGRWPNSKLGDRRLSIGFGLGGAVGVAEISEHSR